MGWTINPGFLKRTKLTKALEIICVSSGSCLGATKLRNSCRSDEFSGGRWRWSDKLVFACLWKKGVKKGYSKAGLCLSMPFGFDLWNRVFMCGKRKPVGVRHPREVLLCTLEIVGMTVHEGTRGRARCSSPQRRNDARMRARLRRGQVKRNSLNPRPRQDQWCSLRRRTTLPSELHQMFHVVDHWSKSLLQHALALEKTSRYGCAGMRASIDLLRSMSFVKRCSDSLSPVRQDTVPAPSTGA